MKVYPERIAGSLEIVFPELGRVSSVSVLSDGVRSLVVSTPTGEVFKIARSWDAGAGYMKEWRLLPLIRSRLPVPIPYPVWHQRATSHFPFGIIGYPRLEGSPLNGVDADCAVAVRLARHIGEILGSLHAIQIDDAIRECVPQPRATWEQLERLRNTLGPPLREVLPAAEYRAIDSWWNALLNDASMRNYEPVLHHGDFWHGNMLVDDDKTQIVGLIDFEDAAAGDPAQDIATLLHFGRAFAEQALTAYRRCGGILDDSVLYRAQRLWELREFSGIGMAIQTTNQSEFEAAITKLRNGPLLNATTRRETQLWPPPPR